MLPVVFLVRWSAATMLVMRPCTIDGMVAAARRATTDRIGHHQGGAAKGSNRVKFKKAGWSNDVRRTLIKGF